MRLARPRGLALLGIALLAVAAWRAWPRALEEGRELPALRVVVFDASAGTTRRRPGWGVWARRALRDEALEARERGQELAVVVYGSDVRRIEGGPSPRAWLEQLAGRGGRTLSLELEPRGARASELDAALGAVESDLLAPGRSGRSLTLFAAPDWTGRDPVARLARMQRAGVAVEWREPPPARLPDLAVCQVSLPSAPVVGEPLTARVDLALAPGVGRAVGLELLVTQESREGRRELTVPLGSPETALDAAGYQRFSRAIELGPTPDGRSHVVVRARVTPAGAARAGDAIPENDTLGASVHAGDARLAALVAAPDRTSLARAWLAGGAARWPGLQWFVVTPEELLALAGEVDLIVSLDLALEELPERELRHLLARGGGWLHCGGWRMVKDLSSASRAEGDAGLNGLLPLVSAADEAPPRDVVFLVDGSGSMVGEPFAHVRSALAQLVRIAPRTDELRLRFFTGTLGSAIVLDTDEARLGETLLELERLRVPGGPTAILYSLEQLVDARASRDRPALVLMLSDGRDVNAFDTVARGAALRSSLAEQGAELRALATGEDADLSFLEALLGGVEGLVRAEDLTDLGELFQREVFAEAVREGPLAVEVASTSEGALGADLVSAWRDGGVRPPVVRRYVRARTRPGAASLWTAAAHDEPVLALQRVSAGWVAAWSSAPFAPWSPEYARADGLLAPLFRFLASGGRRSQRPRLVVDGDELRLEGVPRSWPVRVAARFRGVTGSGGRPVVADLPGGVVELDLGAARPGQDPRDRRSARLPDFLRELPAGAPLSVELGPREAAPLAVVGFAAPALAEFTPGGPRLEPGPWAAAGGALEPEEPLGVDPWAWIYALMGALLLCGAALSGLGARNGG